MKEFPANGWQITRTIFALSFFFCVQARAHVYVVTDTNDTTSVTSLRGAIIDANARGGENTIILGQEPDPRRREPAQTWTFYLTIPGQYEVAAQTGDLDITAGKLSIIGAAPSVTINATALGDRVFHVWPGASLDLENLFIIGGSQPYPQAPGGGGGVIISFGGYARTPVLKGGSLNGTSGTPAVTTGGGGILNAGTLVLKYCTVEGNSTTDEGSGGGILNAGSLLMENCGVYSNSTISDFGGGVFNQGSMWLINCNLGGNASANSDGGAIYNAGTLTVSKCLINSNSAFVQGGGIYEADSGALEMKDSTITGNSSGADGGGLFNAGSVTLENCVVSHNLSDAGNGGGISSLGDLELSHCTVSGNSAGAGGDSDGSSGNSSGGNGGGINNLGALTVRFSTIDGNSAGLGGLIVFQASLFGFEASVGGNGGNGGGIYSTNSLVLLSCTVSGNFAGAGGGVGSGSNVYINLNASVGGGEGGNGGGIYNLGNFQLNSCTIANNHAGVGGAGLPAVYTFIDSNGFFGIGTGIPPAGATIVDVFLSGGAGGNGGSCGGVYDASGSSSAIIENTLVALNLAGTGGTGGTSPSNISGTRNGSSGQPGSIPDVFGPFISQGFNLIGAADGSTGFTNSVLADQVGTTNAPIDPLIGPLQMNGGPTATHALLRGSPAINKGNCFGVHQDQRGEYRPFDYPGISFALGGDGSDIGAFELHVNERFEPPRDIFDRR